MTDNSHSKSTIDNVDQHSLSEPHSENQSEYQNLKLKQILKQMASQRLPDIDIDLLEHCKRAAMGTLEDENLIPKQD